ncbi:DUF3325 domain-containing protein [Pseudomonas sp. Q2-TVG4-2]|uniref:DUF3325 domain-containing protein n=1 Tax=Pseudomonas sp. Q2-TVG4-2 TaxID=1685699 RepID=UPI0015E7A632|nr:DUF3325 domain-containing protein [Pseudomonas sp. Q2-TVG4-2]
MTTLAFALAYLGMLALCLALTRHHRAIFNTAPTSVRQRWLRVAATGLLLGTTVVNVASLGVAIGLVVCLAQLMLAGLAVSLTLAWRERWVVPLGALLSLLGVLFAVGGG